MGGEDGDLIKGEPVEGACGELEVCNVIGDVGDFEVDGVGGAAAACLWFVDFGDLDGGSVADGLHGFDGCGVDLEIAESSSEWIFVRDLALLS